MQAAAELHLVHHNNKYANLTYAENVCDWPLIRRHSPAGLQFADGAVVLGVLIEVCPSCENPAFQPIVDAIANGALNIENTIQVGV